MSFRDCIQSALDTGRLSAKKAAEAFAEYDKEYTRATSAGEPDGVADRLAADASLERITTLKSAKRWDRLNTMQRAHEIYTRFQGADPVEELGKIPLEMELSQEAVRSIAMASLDSFMQRFGPKLAGFKKLGDDIRGVIRAAYDEGGSAFDKLHAKAVIEVREMLRKWANMYGASIPENANAKIPQTHDPVLVRKVEENEWVQDHKDNLDWDVMRFQGQLIPEDKRDEILRHTYQGIINEGFDRGDPAQLHQLSLGNRLNRDRFLYYKNADSYIAMQEKYGAGNFYEQTIGMIETMAKDISILKTFGPAPDAMKEFTKRVGGLRASELNTAAKAGKKNIVDKYQRAERLFDREYQIHSWHNATADGNLPVQTFATVRTTAVTALLGKSFFSNFFSDLANASIMKRVVGLPQVSVFRSYTKEFLSSKRAKMEAAQLGVIQENMISLIQARMRYFGTLDGPAVARRISDTTYRLGLVSYHTQVHRNGQGKQLLGAWANHAHLKFDDLPFAPFLIEAHITPEDWDMFRVTPLTDVRGAKFLTPRAMFEAGDDAQKKVAEKFAAAMQLFQRVQVPDTSLRSRAAMGESLDPNSATGQAVRTMSSLMSFPTAIWFEQVARIAHLPNVRDKVTLGAAYVGAMTLAGMAIVQAKDILTEGYNPDAYNDPQFLLRSIQAGGGFGVVGDIIFNSINTNNSGRFNSNPTFNWLAKARDLTLGNMFKVVRNYGIEHEWWEGEPSDINVAGDAYALLDASVPDLWQTQLLFNRAIKDNLIQTIDPAQWERRQRFMEQHDQGMWWAPGEQPHAPDFSTVGGHE